MFKTKLHYYVLVSLSVFTVTGLPLVAEEETGTSAEPYLEGTPKPVKPKRPTPTPKPFVSSIGRIPVKPKPFVSSIGKVPVKPKPVVSSIGKVSVPDTDALSAGKTTLKGTFTFDFDNGTSGGEGDVFWRQANDVERSLVPRGGAMLAYLGTGKLADFSYERLKSERYSSAPINGSNNSGNALLPGSVVAIKTRSGHYTKMRVDSYGYDLGISWKTYK